MRFRELFEAEHVVAKGDTLWALSKKFGIPVADIAKASGITDPNKLSIGQKIVIPGVDPGTAPVPLPRSARPTSASQIGAAPKAPNQISANPANVTGAPAPLPPGQVSANPANVNGAPAVDPVAAAKAQAAAAGAQAAELQKQAQAGQAALNAKVATQNQNQFRAADAASMKKLPPTAATLAPNQISANPANITGAPTAAMQQQADQDAAYADRIAQADAEEAQAAAATSRALGGMDLSKTPSSMPGMDDGLNGFDLGQYGRDKMAAPAAAPNPLTGPGGMTGTKGATKLTDPDGITGSTKLSDPKGTMDPKEFDLNKWVKDQAVKKAADSL